MAGRYDNPLPTRFLSPIDNLKIPAQYTNPVPTRFLSRIDCFKIPAQCRQVEKRSKMTDLARLFSSSASSISSLAVSPSPAPTSCLSTANRIRKILCISLTDIFFCGLECVGHSLAYVAHFVLLKDDWIRTERAAVTSKYATNLATHLPYLAHPSLYLANHLPV